MNQNCDSTTEYAYFGFGSFFVQFGIPSILKNELLASTLYLFLCLPVRMFSPSQSQAFSTSSPTCAPKSDKTCLKRNPKHGEMMFGVWLRFWKTIRKPTPKSRQRLFGVYLFICCPRPRPLSNLCELFVLQYASLLTPTSSFSICLQKSWSTNFWNTPVVVARILNIVCRCMANCLSICDS